jgi:transaldolase / glucose-6-phosphate isomerase
MNPLKQLEQCGQSPWLDFVRRSLIQKGELQTLIERDGLKGVTSNPSIFEKAIGHSEEYADDLKSFQRKGDHGISAIYDYLAMGDIRAGADVLQSVYGATKRRDGYISLECSPYLANDTEGTLAEARRLWREVRRENLMVKVPGTEAGVPAIRTLISEGLNINVTLLFGIGAYEKVVEAYIAGLEDLAKAGGDVSRVASVASFFVSRIDALVDKRIDAATAKGGHKAALDALRGKVAIANAKLAYERYKTLFAGPRWEALAAKGAQTQRLLWASTGTKNPAYPDTYYIDTLIGRDTVNTMPPATMDAFRDHGTAKPNTVEEGLEDARAVMRALEKHGISLDAVTAELVVDGVQQFADAFDQLLGAVAKRRRTLFEGDRKSLELELPSALEENYKSELEAWRKEGRVRQLWRGDNKLWTGTDEDKWTGWLHIVKQELEDVGTLQRFAAWGLEQGFSDVVLLGMGGSSLGPEVLSETFGPQAGWPRFHMLDSTDPAQVKAVENAIGDLKNALFIASSKSGSTLEPNIYMAYFFQRVREAGLGDKAGSHFVAVTDPGSSMEQKARELGFAHVFYGVKSIGGRYSVLSKFGLVPAAAMGIDVKRLLEVAEQMVRACAEDVPPAENPGVQLGVALGVAARQAGRDKVTIIASPGIADLGAWLEQLIAESTGKQGHGLIPVDGEALGTPEQYGQDRFFAYLELEGAADPAQRQQVDGLAKAGHPVARILLQGKEQIGQAFFEWEIATAVAGAVIDINPFDQPDVEASKIATRELTDEYEKTGSLRPEQPFFRANGVALYADAENARALGQHNDLPGYLRSHLDRAKDGDYVALLAYIERSAAHTAALQAIRTRIRDKTRDATCLGFGPRFLHSTGQAYKGGPNSGVFVQVTCDDPADLEVPGQKYTFGVVKAAQARGDFDVLIERHRRALRVHLHEVDAGLAELARAVDEALS